MCEANIVVPYGDEIDLGIKHSETLMTARKAASEAKKADAAASHQKWILAAKKVWERHPLKSATDVADLLKRELKLVHSIGWIRKRIASAKPNKVGTV